MSVLPYLIEMDHPRRLHDHHFAVGMTPDHYLNMPPTMLPPFCRPWKKISSTIVMGDPGSTIKMDKKRFQVNLDVHHFAPEEIGVKTSDGFLVVEAKHEEKQDQHGFIMRQFTRRYKLPDGCKDDLVVSRLSSDGVLSVSAPYVTNSTNERLVPIIQTGPMRTEYLHDARRVEKAGNQAVASDDAGPAGDAPVEDSQ